MLRGGTEAGYASLINNQPIPGLEKIRVTRMRFEHVEAAVSGMIEDQLAPQTIQTEGWGQAPEPAEVEVEYPAAAYFADPDPYLEAALKLVRPLTPPAGALETHDRDE